MTRFVWLCFVLLPHETVHFAELGGLHALITQDTIGEPPPPTPFSQNMLAFRNFVRISVIESFCHPSPAPRRRFHFTSIISLGQIDVNLVATCIIRIGWSEHVLFVPNLPLILIECLPYVYRKFVLHMNLTEFEAFFQNIINTCASSALTRVH